MATVDRVLPWRRHQPSSIRVRPRRSGRTRPAPRHLPPRHPKASISDINRAYRVASDAHRSQMRKSGESYINHPLAVAQIVADIGLDEVSVAAALLHDAVEDTEITLGDVERDFGPQVAAIVDGVTKLERIRFDSRRAAGRDDAQDARRYGEGPAGPGHQAGRSSAQHAHDRGDAAREAAADRAGDPRHLRTARAPARDAGDQVSNSRTCRSRRCTPSGSPKLDHLVRVRTPERDVYLAKTVAEVRSASRRS